MSKYLRPSSWGLKAIDLIFILIVVALALKLVAPTSGVAHAIHTFCGWLATGVLWISNILAQFLTWL
jgi:hypothetical protein